MNRSSLALGRRVEQFLDRAQFGVPPGQLGLQPVDPLAAAHPGQHPGGPPQRLRLRLALQRVLPGVGETDRAVRQPLRCRVDQHRAGFGRCLHPGRGVHCIPGHHALAGSPARQHRNPRKTGPPLPSARRTARTSPPGNSNAVRSGPGVAARSWTGPQTLPRSTPGTGPHSVTPSGPDRPSACGSPR